MGAYAIATREPTGPMAELQGSANLTIKSIFETKGTLYSENFENGVVVGAATPSPMVELP